jgi:membrane protein implicated in regulation of membrane protease activity
MGEPIFIPSVFFKVLAVAFLVAVAGIVGVILIAGSITTLDLGGTLISMIIIAYIVHLWIYYGRRSKEEE